MKTDEAIQMMRDVIRRKHFSLSTEDAYCGWLRRFCSHIKKLPPQTPNEGKSWPQPARWTSRPGIIPL
ncbi:MAG: hypothetical protein HZA89_01660 [Verrucomicrobia bacterium]|nr:hypothetical protein [Verrucomicrobiota bacterium]